MFSRKCREHIFQAKAEDDKNAFASNTDKNILLILKHPVHLVIYMEVVYAGFAWTTPGKEEVVNVWNTFSSKNLSWFYHILG